MTQTEPSHEAEKAVLWDMDGVLVDTGNAHYQSWKEVLPDYGVTISRDFFQSTFGMNNTGILTILLGESVTSELLAEISDRKEAGFRQAVRGRVQPLPGVAGWLVRLQQGGFRQGIASSAPLANIDALVGELGMGPRFDRIVSGVDLPGKPDPAVFLELARHLGVRPRRCIVVEDAVAGVQAAKRAGMSCIAVTTTNPASALESADLVVDSLDTLPPDAFQELLARARS